jgi:hypothetical protein
MVAEIALDNSQYFRDWFKTHWVNIGVKVSNIFCTITHIWGIGIFLRKAIISLESQRFMASLNSKEFFLVKSPRMWIQSWQKCSILKGEDLHLCKPYWAFLSSLFIFLVQMVVFFKEDWILKIETFFISLQNFRSFVAYRQHDHNKQHNIEVTWVEHKTQFLLKSLWGRSNWHTHLWHTFVQ